MSYGMEMLSSTGDRITNFEHVLYEKDSGTLINTPDPVGGAAKSSGIPFRFYHAPTNTYANKLVGHTIRTIDYTYTDLTMATESWEYTDIAFYEIGTSGIYWSMQYGIETDTTSGSQMTVCVSGNVALNWKVASITPPSATVGNYGIQLRNESDNVVFDSRRKHLPISSHIYISRSDILSVLDNNAVIDYSLPEPVPNALISMSYWAHFKKVSTFSHYFVKVTQTSPTNIRISRTREWAALSYQYRYITRYWHDSTILVAPNI